MNIRAWLTLLSILLLGVSQNAAFALTPTILHSFSGSDGSNPRTGVTLGSDGFLYGGTQAGGANGAGTLFRSSTAGGVTTLHSMVAATDGKLPFGIFDTDAFSNYYGTASSGGPGGHGTVFLTTSTGIVTVLHAFSGTDGDSPDDGLVTDGAGNFYGVTFAGGTSSAGTIYSVTSAGAFTSLYSLNGTTDGKNPHSCLIIGSDGNLYGTAEFGGANNAGVFFRYSFSGGYTVLHNFVATTEGANPVGQLVVAPDGNLYGTCASGGANNAGTFFRIGYNGVVTNIHSFTNSTEGLNPTNIMLARDGVFYGTTEYGGVTINNGGQTGIGSLFSYSPTLRTFTVLHRFTAVPDAENPFGALVQASDNNIYATTLFGGTSDLGTLYRFAPGAADTSKPVTSASLTGTLGLNGWYTSSVQVTLTATDLDGAANVAATYYAVNGGAPQFYTGPITISAQGATTLTYWSVDWARNVEATNSRTIDIDTVAPVTTASISGTLSNGLYQGSATVTLTATDSASGVANTFYTLDGGLQQTYSAPLVLAANGPHTLTYWSVDVAGNTEVAGSSSLTVDSTIPTTTASFAGTAGSNGWYTGPVTVTLTATDPDGVADVASTFYTVDGGAQQTYSAPFTVSGDGSHALAFWSVDKAGNTETANAATVDIDGTAPTLTFGTPTPAANGAGWNNTAVDIPYTTADATSGVASSTPGSPVHFATEGTNQTQSVTVTDNAGNAQSFTSPPVNIDLTAPVTTAAQSGAQNATVTLAATDNLSGVANTFYTVDGGARQTYSAPFTVTGGGTHTVAYWSVDVAGNTETSHTLSISVDASAPTTTASFAGTAGSNGWYTGPVTVTLTATDPDGVADVTSTFYTVDGGAQQTYSAPFTVSGDGSHALAFWSVDKAGNTETANAATVNIDGTAPTLTFGTPTPAANGAGWNNTAVDIPYTTADATSGVASSTPGSPVHFATEGTNQTQSVTVTDIAGNAQSFTSPPVNIDLTAPVTTAAQSGAQNATVTLAATDNLSGVANTYYTVDGGARQTYSAPFTVTGGGTHTVAYWSVDVAGNTETSHTLSISVDASAPTTTASFTGTAGSNGWYTSAVTVTLSATDADGIAATYYTVDGGARQTYSAPFTVSGDGSHALTFWSVDNAGITEPPNAATAKIDTIAPVTTATPTGSQSGGSYTGPVTVTLAATDNLSGVGTTGYTVDGGSQQTYSSSFTISSNGSHTVTYQSTDNAGNTETTKQLTFTISTSTGGGDTSVPSTTGSVAGTTGTNGWFKSAVTVTLTATDPDGASDVAATYYTIDGGAQLTYSAPFAISADGIHSLAFWSADKAGNTETQEMATVKIDTVPPVTTAATTGWPSVTVTLHATDATSGVQSTYYAVDGGNMVRYAAPFTLKCGNESDGDNDRDENDGRSHTVAFYSVDMAGNVESTKSISISSTKVELYGLSPNRTALGSGDTSIMLYGSGFEPGSHVEFGSSSYPSTFIDPNTLGVTIPKSEFKHRRDVRVKVITPEGKRSRAVRFSIEGKSRD